MTIQTRGETEEIEGVQDAEGNTVPAANADAQGNWGSLSGFKHTTDAADVAEPLESHAVPDGVTVLVNYLASNGDTVYVGNADVQPAPLTSATDGLGFDVQDTSEIYVRTVAAGDGVGVLFEDA